MRYQKIIAIFICFVMAGGYSIVKKTRNVAHNQFVVGMAAGYAPFVSINPQGEYEGFDIDVAYALAQKMGTTLILKDLGSMTSLFAALQQGSIDAIIWGMAITADRLEKVAMIHYQGEVTQSYPLIFWQKIPEGITTIGDMQGKVICVEPTSAQEAVIRHYPLIKQLSVEKVDDALLNIQYGKADAALVEPAIAKKFKRIYPEIQIFDVSLSSEDQVHGIGVVIEQNNTLLINNVYNALTLLKAKGIIEQLEQKWDI